MSIPGVVTCFNLFGYCSLQLWCGFSTAQTPVLNLEDRRLFMSFEQRAAIDHSEVAVKSLDTDTDTASVETKVEELLKYRSPGRMLKLNGIVMRSDGKVFGWVNSNPPAEVTPQHSAVYARGVNADEKFIIAAGKAPQAVSPGQSILLEPGSD